jgi:monoamine oxidase
MYASAMPTTSPTVPFSDTPTDVIIIGAGAAGLLAARTLATGGLHVRVLEANNRLGGRVHTCQPPGFAQPVEAGAEFMHGEVPLTQALLTEAGIGWHSSAGRTYRVLNGQLQTDNDFETHLPQLLAKLNTLAQDLPLADFLVREFAGESHAPLQAWATQFAEGYDAADTRRVSSWALREEWATDGAEDSPRPVGGYGPLLHWLAIQAQAAGCQLHLATPVQEIRWQPGMAEVVTNAGAHYQARQVLCTVSLGVWQREEGQPGYMRWLPELPTHRAAAAQLGFGTVIKVVLEFQEAFWHERFPELDFLFSDAPVPTWWSQSAGTRPQLLGWLAGPAAEQWYGAPAAAIIDLALTSLAGLLAISLHTLKSHLSASYVHNWGTEPHTYGAYSYATVGAPAARAALAAPVADTLFFAGEGLVNGSTGGTVEAALASGLAAARTILAK